MYQAYGLLARDSDFNLDEAAARLAERFPEFIVRRVGDEVHVTKSDWELKLRIEDGAHVRDESVGLAGRIAGLEPAEAGALEASDRRAEMWSDTQDPFIEHLSDFHAAVEVLKSFPGLIAVDPNEPALM
jgi:hypothetical protein